MAQTAQINVRLDAGLKAAGDEALALAGFSPSEAVRALWAKAALGGDSLKEIVECLRPPVDEHDEERDRRLRLVEGMSGIAADVCSQYGLLLDYSRLRPMTEDDIEQAAFEDYLAEGMVR